VIEGLLLDIDGVLTVSWEALPGSVEAIERLITEGVPFRLITNTTTHTRRELAQILQGAGFAVDADAIITAVVATAQYLRASHPGAAVFVLSDGAPGADMEEVKLVDEPEAADVVVLGGAGAAFGYDVINRIFRAVVGGAALVCMHRNFYWQTDRGLELDGGAYVVGLEAATGVTATVCGKPAPAFFNAALEMLGLPARRAAMVGDDITNDVLGAQAAGLTGILVRTGKFRPSDLSRGEGEPDHIVDRLADVPDLINRT
jgi:HAD superfamily hydrolase (TIGR01458 family)